MDAISDALVYAVAYVSQQSEDVEDWEGEDDSAIAHVMAYLSEATPAEEDALAEAAKRALAEEQSLITPQQEMIELFSSWMEHVFGRDWEGNDRA